jgi:hypothetical protein
MQEGKGGVGPVDPDSNETKSEIEQIGEEIEGVCVQIEAKIAELEKILSGQDAELQKMGPGWADAGRQEGWGAYPEDKTFLKNFEVGYAKLKRESENTQDPDSLKSILKLLNEKIKTITARIKGLEGVGGLPLPSTESGESSLAASGEFEQVLRESAYSFRDQLENKKGDLVDLSIGINRRLDDKETEELESLVTQAGKLLFPDQYIEKMNENGLEEYIQKTQELTARIIIFMQALRSN